jgi:hypothetical protein
MGAGITPVWDTQEFADAANPLAAHLARLSFD